MMDGKIFGISLLLVGLCLFLAITQPGEFLKPNNIENLLERTAMYGILGIGVAFVIITSGIDLSVGSIVCLSACLLPMFLRVSYLPPDEHRVLAVEAAEKRIVLPGNVNTFQPGDEIRFYDGRRARVAALTVTAVNPHRHKTLAATAIQVDKPLSKDDDRGKIAKFYAIQSFRKLTAEGESAPPRSLITIAGDNHRLQPRDQMDLVHPAGRLKRCVILSAEVIGSDTQLQIKGDLGQLDNLWAAIPRKRRQRMPIVLAVGLVLAIGAGLGAIHGLLVTKMRLQPFIVTLCGLLIYRGLARWLVDEEPQGFGQEYNESLSLVAQGKFVLFRTESYDFGIPYLFFILVVLALLAAVFLNKTIWGRYLMALGRNEAAARFSGINTHRLTIFAYVICTFFASLGGMLFALDSNSVSPSSYGNWYELYAIAAAVLGGCSLRGGEGGILGVVIGTAVMQTLRNLIVLKGITDALEFSVIGAVILVGVIGDELIKRFAERRRTRVAARVQKDPE